ncbi:hypothetical protein HG536_0A03060 [Torulaspora globosa]|uniref:Bacteriophage T5 Orf172 DNA-binding domain-containing protein n=1 Tax=Torulaspora globosa TaxID=48254 RepID=A0A7G3ZAF3_9SACH|nr:uncharacterized protein HG536_0A03060 [Torulaspora globosa]QLL30489.1 hypothetical protein HG536_0A03060 [Torulaspora globosa]
MYDAILEGGRRELPWLLVDDSVLSPATAVARRPWSNHTHILCKIGMTTNRSVSARLQQWQHACKHPVVNLTPETVEPLLSTQRNRETTLSRLLSKLTISRSKTPTCRRELNVPSYKDGGFWVAARGSLSLPMVENAIHRHLWARLGQGLVYCYGCDSDGPKRHKEWFRLPISELPRLFRTVDSFCRGVSDS